MYHLLPRFLPQVNVSCRGGAALVCGDFWWPTCMHQSEPHLAVSYASGEIPHPHAMLAFYPPSPDRYYAHEGSCANTLYGQLTGVDASGRGRGWKTSERTLFSILALLILALTDISPLTALRTPCFCKGGPPKWNSPESYCAEVRCGKGPNWQLRLVAASSNIDLPITEAYLSLIWPRKNWKLLNNSWVITQTRANLQVISWFSPHVHILKKESSIFFSYFLQKLSAFNIVAIAGDIHC